VRRTAIAARHARAVGERPRESAARPRPSVPLRRDDPGRAASQRLASERSAGPASPAATTGRLDRGPAAYEGQPRRHRYCRGLTPSATHRPLRDVHDLDAPKGGVWPRAQVPTSPRRRRSTTRSQEAARSSAMMAWWGIGSDQEPPCRRCSIRPLTDEPRRSHFMRPSVGSGAGADAATIAGPGMAMRSSVRPTIRPARVECRRVRHQR
jgi:hypothetical protein